MEQDDLIAKLRAQFEALPKVQEVKEELKNLAGPPVKKVELVKLSGRKAEVYARITEIIKEYGLESNIPVGDHEYWKLKNELNSL